MDKVRLGKTGLMVTRTAFGALPIQRVDQQVASAILRRAHDAGVNFFDTARAYSDSEEKIGLALADVRDDIIIATKSHAADRQGVLDHVAASLSNMKTDHVDILQAHNPSQLPDPSDDNSAYAGLVEARRKGLTRFIGITAHSLDNARAAAESGLYDTVQFPLSAISASKDIGLIELCRKHDVGLIAMKALCGGLLTDAARAFAFLRQYENVVPIWGIQRMEELEQFIALDANPPALDDQMRAAIETDRAELAAAFCRGCGYCLPCPADIPIPFAARMQQLLRRAPSENFLTEDWQEKMSRIEQCTECGQCRRRCPYSLDVPLLLRLSYKDYQTYL